MKKVIGWAEIFCENGRWYGTDMHEGDTTGKIWEDACATFGDVERIVIHKWEKEA